MKTFLQETLEAIKDSGHKESDVMFIGSSDGVYRLSFKDFAKIADFTYDSGFGAQEIAKDLIIYFKDKTYIQRSEYDGSEWWEYNVPKVFAEKDPSKPYTVLSPRHVGRTGWESVEEINNGKFGYGED